MVPGHMKVENTSRGMYTDIRIMKVLRFCLLKFSKSFKCYKIVISVATEIVSMTRKVRTPLALNSVNITRHYSTGLSRNGQQSKHEQVSGTS